MIKKVLVGTDGSHHSNKALKTAKELLRMNSEMEITIIHITEVPSSVFGLKSEIPPAKYEETTAINAEMVLASAKEFFSIDGFNVFTLSKFGNSATVICEVAKYEEFDLIIVGSRGLSAVQGLFMGSVSNHVAHLAHCPVMVVK